MASWFGYGGNDGGGGEEKDMSALLADWVQRATCKMPLRTFNIELNLPYQTISKMHCAKLCSPW